MSATADRATTIRKMVITRRTYIRDGREVYADTGRPVDERLGTHMVLWVVTDPEAYAAAIERQGDDELTAWKRSGRAAVGAQRRDGTYAMAARIRSEGTKREPWHCFHWQAEADAYVADFNRAHPEPGRHAEVAEITGTGACEHCRQPIVQVEGRWYHHLGRFPAECAGGYTTASPADTPNEPRGADEVLAGAAAAGGGRMSGVDDLVTWLRAQYDAEELVVAALDTVFGDILRTRERALAEITADRRILQEWSDAEARRLYYERDGEEPFVRESRGYAKAMAKVLRIRARRFADRPGYRLEWLP